jgi:hypothetical protein
VGDVVEINFGKRERETIKVFMNLFDFVVERERDIINDPIKYFNIACDEINRLRKFKQEMLNLQTEVYVSNVSFSSTPDSVALPEPTSINIPYIDYKLLKKFKEKVKND